MDRFFSRNDDPPLTINLMRHILHGLPCGISTLSVFLRFLFGPTGQSGYAIIAIPLIEQDINKLLLFISSQSALSIKFESIY